jgi:hypothetical protein
MEDERSIVIAHEEPQHLPVIIKELLLGGDSASTEGLLHELLEFGVSDLGLLDLCLREVVHRIGERSSLWLFVSCVEVSRVLVTVNEAEAATENVDIAAYLEIKRHVSEARAVLSEHLPSLKEFTLRDSAVKVLWFANHNCVVLQEIKDDHFPHAERLNPAFNYSLLKITVKAKNL